MKKFAVRVLCTIAAFAFLGLLLKVVTISFAIKEDEPSQEKLYTLLIQTSSPAYRIGAVILRPILEARIDDYIKRQGLEQYLQDIKASIPLEENFSYSDIEQGEGPEVFCGQEVSALVRYLSNASHNNWKNPLQIAENIMKDTQHVQFRLGMHEIKELNHALVGMRKGGSRTVVIQNEKGSEHYYVQLLSIDSSEPKSEILENLLIFDRLNQNYKGIRGIARCGNKVSISYTLRDSDAKVLIKDTVVNFTIGAREVPIALELGAVNLRFNHLRSVIVPPELLSGLNIGKETGTPSVKVIDFQVVPGHSDLDKRN